MDGEAYRALKRELMLQVNLALRERGVISEELYRRASQEILRVR